MLKQSSEKLFYIQQLIEKLFDMKPLEKRNKRGISPLFFLVFFGNNYKVAAFELFFVGGKKRGPLIFRHEKDSRGNSIEYQHLVHPLPFKIDIYWNGRETVLNFPLSRQNQRDSIQLHDQTSSRIDRHSMSTTRIEVC